jgi:hypothetical protein
MTGDETPPITERPVTRPGDTPEFRAVRHRYWALGKTRRLEVLNELVPAAPGEALHEGIERQKLFALFQEGKADEIIAAIGRKEEEAQHEEDDAEYVDTALIAKALASHPSGRVHVGNAEAGRSPWET